ncbi:MAG TPA: sigma-70 family RNA polymerase sigma factor [Polyangiaceae bacterium]|nr:sigma-70 family RNA polymerase sigma factor [Polyangiaceae bacterium]
MTPVITYMAPPVAHASTELDAATLEGCRVGDPEALRSFVVRYERVVFAFLSRTLGSGPHVEDLAQETFLRACRALRRFDASGPARLSTWLLTIATRLVQDERRKRRPPLQPLEAELPAIAPGTPETERRRAELGRALSQAAAQLSDDQRDVFVLAEFHGMDMKEIGQVLGVPEGTVKTRLFRARERLRELLQSVWEDT